MSCRTSTPAVPQQVTLFAWTNPGAFTRELTRHYNESIPGIHVSLQPTAGSVFVVSALDRGAGDLGFAQADVVYNAYGRGVEEDPHAHTNLRGIAVLWVNTVYVVVPRNSTFRRIADLRGKRVGVGPRGSSAELVARLVLEGYRMGYSDVDPQFLTVEDTLPRVDAGTLDAALLVVATFPERLDTREASHHRLLPISREVMNSLRARYPFIKPSVIPAHPLAGQSEDVPTVGVDGLLVCRKDLDEDLLYKLTKEFFAILPRLAESDPLAAQIDPENAPATPIPLHPGAARYYREREIVQ